MAFSSLRQCKPSLQMGSLYIRNLASASAPKPPAFPTAGAAIRQDPGKVGAAAKTSSPWLSAHGAAPLGTLAALIVAALMIGVHTATQHLVRSPTVHVTKKNRESMPEVSQPGESIRSGGKFIDKSFLRKVGHLQDKQYGDETGPNIYTRSRKFDTLQSVGVIDKD